MRARWMILGLLLAGCQPAAPTATSASATAAPVAGMPTAVGPITPPALALVPEVPLPTAAHPPLGDRLRYLLTTYAALDAFARPALGALAASTAQGDVDVTAGGQTPLVARVQKQPAFTSIQIATGSTFDPSHILFSLSYDGPAHGYALYKPASAAGRTVIASHFSPGAALVDFVSDFSTPRGKGRQRVHQELNNLATLTSPVSFGLRDSRVLIPAGGMAQRTALSAAVMHDPVDQKADGGVAAIYGHQTPDGFDYLLEDGTVISNVKQTHAQYAELASPGVPGLVSVKPADAPDTLLRFVPQDGTLSAFPPDPTDQSPFSDPANGVN